MFALWPRSQKSIVPREEIKLSNWKPLLLELQRYLATVFPLREISSCSILEAQFIEPSCLCAFWACSQLFGRGVAQLAEHRFPKPGVAGSIPAAPVIEPPVLIQSRRKCFIASIVAIV